MPPKGSAASGWNAEEEMEFTTRLLFHVSGMPSLVGFEYKDRSTSSMRNKLHGLAKKFNIDPNKPGIVNGDAKPKASRAKKAISSPKKRKTSSDDNSEDGGSDDEAKADQPKPKKTKATKAKAKPKTNEVDDAEETQELAGVELKAENEEKENVTASRSSDDSGEV